MLFVLVGLLVALFGVNCNPIINGVHVNTVKHPFVVRLRISTVEHNLYTGNSRTFLDYCGGSIISHKTILTAAHCLEKSIRTPNVEAYAGVIFAHHFKKKGQFKVMDTYDIHPNYESENIDLALIHLVMPFIIVPGFVEVGDFTTAKVDSKVIITGWGITEKLKRSKILREANMKLINPTKCSQSFQGINDFLCIIDKSKMITFCDGDSGGPLIFNNKITGVLMETEDREVKNADGNLVTICNAKKPAVCLNVTPHTNWIADKIQM